ncbi:MAG: DUF2089 domain-containing protein, partial [Chloroflexi bacterium]|nr:DUF2089 domain-containing protein [Chloroflexota bacterium]
MDERRMILEMLSNGKITADEASKLFDALTVSDAKAKVKETAVPKIPQMPRFVPPVPPVPPVHHHDPRYITPAYAEAIAQAGLPDLDKDQLWQLQIHHVTANYVRQLLALGLPDLDINAIV